MNTKTRNYDTHRIHTIAIFFFFAKGGSKNHDLSGKYPNRACFTIGRNPAQWQIAESRRASRICLLKDNGA